MAADKGTAPFLSKCYTMVDDPDTDSIISWGSAGTSFIIWDITKLEQELLPKYYKHRNISSFIRQLNLYGFKKYDPDRWEFTNDGFIKGQKHLLKNIIRKKPSQANGQLNQTEDDNSFTRRESSEGNGQQNQSQENNNSSSACVEVGKFGVWEDVENLKKDRNVVMQELAKLRNHQQGADDKLHLLGQRLQGMEISQQQVLSFFAMVVRSPGFLGQLLQQNDSTWRISETSKKRPYLALEETTECNEPVAYEGQIVKYEPPKNEIPKPMLMPASNSDGSRVADPSANGLDDFFMNIELMPSGEGIPVPMEEGEHCENEGQIVISDLLEDDMMEKLLLVSRHLEDSDTTESNAMGTELDHLTKELGLLVSNDNNKDI